MLYLSKELYVGFIKLQADRRLGRSFAGLLPLTEGLYKLGYISKEVYCEHIEKYTKPLGSEDLRPALSLERQKEALSLQRTESQLCGMLEQWDLHPDPVWRKKTIELAKDYADKLPSARKILQLKVKEVEGESI